MFRAIWSFIIGSLRMILFFLCLLYTIGAFISLALLVRADSEPISRYLPDGGVRTNDYLLGLGMIILGLVGSYGSFYKHRPSINAFSVMSALTTILLVLVLIFSQSPEIWRKQNDQMFDKFKDDMPFYSWDHKYEDARTKEATQSWDVLQNLACCGIDGPSDWIKYRPSGSKYKDALPSTCCFHQNAMNKEDVCTKNNMIFATGCSQRFKQVLVITFVMKLVGIGVQLLLTIISFMVGSCSLDPELQNSGRIVGMAPPRVQTIYVDQHYQQAMQPQPMVSQQQYGAHPSAPKIYPYLQSDTNYSAPPPSYGTQT